VAGLVLLALLPLTQLVRVQLDGDSLSRRGLGQRLRPVELPAERGTIVDRTGTELAISMPRTRVAVNRIVLGSEGVDDPGSLAEFARDLAELIDVPAGPVARSLAGARADDPWVKVAETVEPSVAEAAAAALAEQGLGDVLVLEPSTERLHPAGGSGLRVIGTVGPDGPGPLAGVERAYDELLRGRPGRNVVERGVNGETITGGQHVTRPAVPGHDVQLTLDRTLQYETERILTQGTANARARSGIAIVGRPATGELLAVAGVERDERTGEVRLADAPLAFSTAYQAGSVFKLVTVAAGYETGVIDDSSTFTVPDRIVVADRTFRDHEPHSPEQMNVDRIVAESSNVGTIQIARQVGDERLHDALVDFGFGRRTGVGSPAESSGLLPDVEDWAAPDLAAAAIGTFQSTTPIQLWTAYNVIANDGRYVAPRLVDATIPPEGERQEVEPRPTRQVITPETADSVERALRSVVSEGTGKQWDLPGFPVAAKTGTSRMPSPEVVDGEDSYIWPDGRYHYTTTFAGYLPADRPQVSITVMLIDTAPGLTGGTSAGPVFSDLARLSIRELTIAPTATASTVAAEGDHRSVGTPAGTSGAGEEGPVRAAPAAAGSAATDRPLMGGQGSTRAGSRSTTMAGAGAPSGPGGRTTTGATGAGPGHDDG
jgi:cell division protein FtsI (penicillin-binding protein 3)